METVLLAAGQYGPLALALGLLLRIYVSWSRGDLVPKVVVQSMSEAWKATDAIREAARKEERDQLVSLIAELREALRNNRSGAR